MERCFPKLCKVSSRYKSKCGYACYIPHEDPFKTVHHLSIHRALWLLNTCVEVLGFIFQTVLISV